MSLISGVGIRVILVLVVLNHFLIGMIHVAVRLYPLELGASHIALGVMAGASTLIGTLLAIHVDVFSGYLGWRRVILTSLLLFVSSLLEFLSPSHLW